MGQIRDDDLAMPRCSTSISYRNRFYMQNMLPYAASNLTPPGPT